MKRSEKWKVRSWPLFTSYFSLLTHTHNSRITTGKKTSSPKSNQKKSLPKPTKNSTLVALPRHHSRYFHARFANLRPSQQRPFGVYFGYMWGKVGQNGSNLFEMERFCIWNGTIKTNVLYLAPIFYRWWRSIRSLNRHHLKFLCGQVYCYVFGWIHTYYWW